MTWLRFLPLVLVGLVVAALLWRLANPPETAVRSQLVGQAVPQFAAPAALPGKPALESTDLADGQSKLVNFFASWCAPCIGEAPLLEQIASAGVPIVGIAVRDRPEDLRAFLDEHGDPFRRIGADPQSKLQMAFGSAGVPETFVVDGRGIIRMQHVGPIEAEDVPALVEAVRAAQ